MSAVSPLLSLSHQKNLTKCKKKNVYQYSASDNTKTFILKHTPFKLEINDLKLTETDLVCLSTIISFDDFDMVEINPQ